MTKSVTRRGGCRHSWASANLQPRADRVRAGERRRAELLAQLEHVDSLGRAARPTLTRELRAILRARLTDWQGLLRSHAGDARPILRRLLVGRLTATPR